MDKKEKSQLIEDTLKEMGVGGQFTITMETRHVLKPTACITPTENDYMDLEKVADELEARTQLETEVRDVGSRSTLMGVVAQ